MLRPGGRLVIADVTVPRNRLMRMVQRLHSRLLLPRGGHGGPYQVAGDIRIGHHAAPPIHGQGHGHADAPAHGRPRRMSMLEHLLGATGCRSIAPSERFMSAHGAIALYALAPLD